MRSWIAGILVLTAITMGALLAGCDEELAEPQDQGTHFIPDPTGPTVFIAMRESINVSRTDANYRIALSDDFVFSPLPEDSLLETFAGVYDNWDKTRELEILNQLLSGSDHLHVDFAASIEINQDTFVRYRVGYTFDVASDAAPMDTIRYRGTALFDVRRSDGAWRLERWDEIEGVPGFASWGYLRGLLRTGS